MTAHYVTLSVEDEHRKFSIRCNRLAKFKPPPAVSCEYGGDLYFVSGAGTATAVKALTATLNSRRKLGLWIKGLGRVNNDRYVWTDGEGYQVVRHRLGLDQWHVMAWTKNWRFLVEDTDQHLWSALKSENFTTPLLRSWMPYLRARLKSRNYLQELECHRATSRMLYVPSVKLDEIVGEGVAAGELKLEET